MKKKAVAALLLVASVGTLSLLPACTNTDDVYKPPPAYSGPKATLPAVPSLPSMPIKVGDAFSVYGAIHHLNSSVHGPEVNDKELTLVGYIVQCNMETVDVCAVHKKGKADPEGCKTEIPTFWLSDVKGDKKQTIRVMGWASNFANVFDALEEYKNLKAPPKEPYKDGLWAVDVPFPLPAKDAKIKVTGKYGVNFGRSSTGVASDPANGIMDVKKIEYLEPSPEPASFPQLKDAKKK